MSPGQLAEEGGGVDRPAEEPASGMGYWDTTSRPSRSSTMRPLSSMPALAARTNWFSTTLMLDAGESLQMR